MFRVKGLRLRLRSIGTSSRANVEAPWHCQNEESLKTVLFFRDLGLRVEDCQFTVQGSRG